MRISDWSSDVCSSDLDPDLMAKIELAMGYLRSAIGKGRPIAEVEAANAEVARLVVEAEAALSPERASASSSCRSEEHTSELQALMRISHAACCLKKKKETEANLSTSAARITTELQS